MNIKVICKLLQKQSFESLNQCMDPLIRLKVSMQGMTTTGYKRESKEIEYLPRILIFYPLYLCRPLYIY